ncbi:type II toxin-antitoxin system death-on-curing family toxin [Chryseobacterium sp. Ch-15]|nr:type II toxin-antitoxin system death-on-curing family toxin [Chryseobacterium muglaense]MCC9033805.1 type II toxin-antitoxin system death-on-curing family toxin [Chryseobacterium muglaense]MCM2555921.1 type II toxin-antitoxin system death-on-curing family toxin [Chryseobacterium muglaense]
MTKTIFPENQSSIHTLTSNCLINLHELLSNNVHLLEDMDPVEPRGVKSFGLLESAINRQLTGFGNLYKYDTVFLNAATLTFGVIKNHSFHNGNKRAGLLALIKHLYVNNYVLSPSLESIEIYEFLVSIADSKIENFSNKYKKKYTFIRNKEEKKNHHWETDTLIRFIAFWIKKNSEPKAKTIKGNVKISFLKRVLNNKNILLDQSGSNIEVYIEKENKFLGIFKFGTKKAFFKNYSLGNNRTEISKQTLAQLRKDFNLTKTNGIDDTFFYDDDAFLDMEIKTYKKLIYQLSKT